MKKLIVFTLFIALLAAGCAPAAPTQIAAATSSGDRPLATQPAFNDTYSEPAPTYGYQPEAEEPAGQYQPLPTAAYQEYRPEARFEEGRPMTDTHEDHLSTFGLDVDTASYTQARKAILEGGYPQDGSVRVEEFINYFQQDYPSPEGVAFGIYADGARSPFEEDAFLLRFGIQGHRENREDRRPRHLTFVIDASGSMADNGKLELVKQTLEILVERLGPRDTISVVAYDDQAWVVLEPTSANKEDWILSQIRMLEPGNSTNLADGLLLGYQMADYYVQNEDVNRVILCTDGVANTGITDVDVILNIIHDYAGKEVTLTALGFGMGDYNDDLLERLADQGNGNYSYIDDLDEAQRLFIDQLASTLDVIAMNAKVQVDFNPDVVMEYRQLGYEDRAIADQDFRDDRVDAGEIGAGHSVTALYMVRLVPGASGRIATVQLRWEDPQSHNVQEINGNFNTWDVVNSYYEASPRFRQDVVAAYFAGRLRDSHWARVAHWRVLLDMANDAADELRSDNDVQELAYLIRQAGWLDD